ncbi:MAG TPA: hypothetical protein PK808_08310 [Polymorphobacter sp.]|nr:hypothetical protein [Polymorphobacter sp.]
MRNATSRREVLGGLGLTGVGLAAPAFAALPGDADLVVRNARVHTVDDRQPRATAFAVAGGRFVAVGDDDAATAFAGKRTQVIDAKGQAVVPGFIDCHNHAVGEVLLYEVIVGNPFDVEFFSIQSIIDKLQGRGWITLAMERRAQMHSTAWLGMRAVLRAERMRAAQRRIGVQTVAKFGIEVSCAARQKLSCYELVI